MITSTLTPDNEVKQTPPDEVSGTASTSVRQVETGFVADAELINLKMTIEDKTSKDDSKKLYSELIGAQTQLITDDSFYGEFKPTDRNYKYAVQWFGDNPCMNFITIAHKRYTREQVESYIPPNTNGQFDEIGADKMVTQRKAQKSANSKILLEPKQKPKQEAKPVWKNKQDNHKSKSNVAAERTAGNKTKFSDKDVKAFVATYKKTEIYSNMMKNLPINEEAIKKTNAWIKDNRQMIDPAVCFICTDCGINDGNFCTCHLKPTEEAAEFELEIPQELLVAPMGQWGITDEYRRARRDFGDWWNHDRKFEYDRQVNHYLPEDPSTIRISDFNLDSSLLNFLRISAQSSYEVDGKFKRALKLEHMHRLSKVFLQSKKIDLTSLTPSQVNVVLTTVQKATDSKDSDFLLTQRNESFRGLGFQKLVKYSVIAASLPVGYFAAQFLMRKVLPRALFLATRVSIRSLHSGILMWWRLIKLLLNWSTKSAMQIGRTLQSKFPSVMVGSMAWFQPKCDFGVISKSLVETSRISAAEVLTKAIL